MSKYSNKCPTHKGFVGKDGCKRCAAEKAAPAAPPAAKAEAAPPAPSPAPASAAVPPPAPKKSFWSFLEPVLCLAAVACLAGCASGGHTVCYDGRCVHWTNTPPAVTSTNR